MLDLERSSLARYRDEVARRGRLTAEQEHDLARRSRAGDRAATRLLVERSLSSVIAIAVEYRLWRLPIEDLVQEGNVGLLKAVDRFDPDRGLRLNTYARHWIRASIREYVARTCRIVRLGSSKGDRRAFWMHRKTREQRPEVLAEMSGISTERAAELLPILSANDTSLSPSEDGLDPLEKMSSSAVTPEDAMCEADARDRLRATLGAVVSDLSARQQELYNRRLIAEEPATLEELGDAWGVSKERARQIEVETKHRMRDRLKRFEAEYGA